MKFCFSIVDALIKGSDHYFILLYYVDLLLTQAKPEDTLDLCRILNDDLAKTVKKHPKRFVGLGTLPMQVGLNTQFLLVKKYSA